jgi:tripartite ATP-independent transporter DctM subunit
MLIALGLTLILTLVLGVPIAFALGMSGAVALFIGSDVSPLLVLGNSVFRGMDSFPLMAIPFFVLGGELMGVSITTALINFASSLVGHIRGGLAHVTTLSCMFFGGITGVGVAETAAIGTIVIPAMEQKGYDKSFAAAVVAASSTLGPIVPPSVPMVLYALAVGGSVSISALFLAGVIPAILITMAFMVISYFIARRNGYPVESAFELKRVWVTFRKAIWALFMPVIIVGGMVSGVFTATEAAVVSAFYAALVRFLINRNLRVSELPQYFLNTAIVTSIVLMLLGFSKVVSWILTVENVPGLLTSAMHSATTDPLMFMLLVNILLLIVGCFIDSAAGIIMLAPVLAPVAAAFHINPVHFGFMLVMNLILGMVTPPVGVILFVASGISDLKLGKIVAKIWPYVIAAYLILGLVMLFPAITLSIPRLAGY